jgi:hypothetical protein
VVVPPPTGPSVTPPTSIAADCSVDVSHPLRVWFKSLPASTTVVMPQGACYLVNEGIRIKDPQGLTIYGGTYRSTLLPGQQAGSSKGQAAFTLVGGSGDTLEEMQISGVNPGGYHPSLAFAAGVDLEGTANSTVRSITVTNTFGDGISLSPLRGGANSNSGTILAPSSAITIRDVTVSGVGRQGLTFASTSGVQVADVIVKNPGLNTFDVEADQPTEGTNNLTINGCVASGGVIFFANGGAGDAIATHDIAVDNCTMLQPEGGSAIFVKRPGGKGSHPHLRGPITFQGDALQCGASVYTACVQLTGATVTVTSSRLAFPQGTLHEAVYGLTAGSHAEFTNDVVRGFGTTGRVSPTSSVSVNGGMWTPVGGSANKG